MSFVLLSTLLFKIGNSVEPTTAVDWDYNDFGNNVSHWVEFWPECGGNHQSPIDVIIADAQTLAGNNSEYTCTAPLLLDFVSETDQHFAIRNNGHTIQAIPLEMQGVGGFEISSIEILHHTNDTKIRLKNPFFNTYKSNVNSEYCFDSLHFHWGETDEYGSEHAINGHDSPLELHMVHYSCDYYTLKDASKAYENGNLLNKYDDDNVFAVIGVLFEIGPANPVLDAILNSMILEGVRMFADHGYTNLLSFYYTQFNLQQLLPENREMVSYDGSLSSPPCFETVRWNIMKHKMTVSLEQMMRFRYILESTDLDESMAPNWRPLQNIHDRVIYQCKDMIDDENIDKDIVNEKIIDVDIATTHTDHDTTDTEHEHEHEHEIYDTTHTDHDTTEHEHDHHTGHEIMLEMEQGHEKWLWVIIGVLFIVTMYLCYVVNCTTSDEIYDEQKKKKKHTERGTDEEQSVIFDDSADDSV